ncbi:MAG: hypothetical protein JNL95_09135 [Chitinophagales bacterium]|nr:hypothetical protein [Chitinophagales bacterium]
MAIDNLTVSISDMYGRVLKESEMPSGTLDYLIEADSWASGTYSVLVKQKGLTLFKTKLYVAH